jgi:hypothetical protein
MQKYVWAIIGLILAAGFLTPVSFGEVGDERFYGGSYDGYTSCIKTNTSIQMAIPSGIVIYIR